MTDERLRIAAAKVEEAMVQQCDQDFMTQPKPVLSSRFKMKMKRLLLRVSHPYLYYFVLCVSFIFPLIFFGVLGRFLFVYVKQGNKDS